MSITPVDEPPSIAGRAAARPGFWCRLARALDDFFVDRTKRAVSEATLRRSRQEIQRCRRLMLKGAMAPVPARPPVHQPTAPTANSRNDG